MKTRIIYPTYVLFLMKLIKKILKNNLDEYITKKIFGYIPKYNYYCDQQMATGKSHRIIEICGDPAKYLDITYRCSFHIKNNPWKKKYKRIEEGVSIKRRLIKEEGISIKRKLIKKKESNNKKRKLTY